MSSVTLPQKNRDIFGRNPEKLQELLELRRAGMSMPRLGKHFGCDYSTIRYNLVRFSQGLTAFSNTVIVRRGRPRSDRMTAAQMRQTRRQRLSVERIGPTTPCVPLLARRTPKPSEKYQALIDDECVNVNPGKSYREYRASSRKRSKPERDARMALLIAEKKARDQARGHKLLVPRANFA